MSKLDYTKKMKTKTFKSQLSTFKSRAGFTLIELLVVIGVLGILAAGLVATIDPVEQIRKAEDSNVKNTTVEYLNALIRYYSTHQAYPWGTDNNAAGCNSSSSPSGSNLTDVADCTTALIGEKELKGGFTNASNIINKIYISEANNDVSVCFQPQSQAQQKDPNAKYDSTGGTSIASCKSSGTGATSNCYWCAK